MFERSISFVKLIKAASRNVLELILAATICTVKITTTLFKRFEVFQRNGKLFYLFSFENIFYHIWTAPLKDYK
jgi:hypothetical protein